jgi:hypothetical protein
MTQRAVVRYGFAEHPMPNVYPPIIHTHTHTHTRIASMLRVTPNKETRLVVSESNISLRTATTSRVGLVSVTSASAQRNGANRRDFVEAREVMEVVELAKVVVVFDFVEAREVMEVLELAKVVDVLNLVDVLEVMEVVELVVVITHYPKHPPIVQSSSHNSQQDFRFDGDGWNLWLAGLLHERPANHKLSRQDDVTDEEVVQSTFLQQRCCHQAPLGQVNFHYVDHA